MESSPLCIELKRALSAKSDVELLRSDVSHLINLPWAQRESFAADTSYQTGIRLFKDEYYGDAAVYFEEAAEIYRGVQRESSRILVDKKERASDALASRKFSEAIEIYRELIEIEGNEEYETAIIRAEKGLTDESIISQVGAEVTAGSFDHARSLLSQLETDFFDSEAEGLSNDIARAKARIAHDALISKGYAAMDEGDTDAAQKYFKEAVKLTPSSQVAKDGLVEIGEIRMQRDTAILKQQLKIAENEQNWTAAHTAISWLMKLRPEDQQYILRKERYEDMAVYEKRLDFHIRNPGRFSSKNVRRDVNKLLGAYDTLEEPGSTILRKRDELSKMFAAATAKQEIRLGVCRG